MNSAEEYIKRTESAVVKIFDGIDLYLKILRDSPPLIYIGNAGDTLNQRPAYKNWAVANRDAIQLQHFANK